MRHFRGFILFTTIAIVVVSTSLLTTGEELLSPSTQQQQQSKKGQGKNQNQDPSRKKGQGQGNNQDPARKKGQGQQKNGGNQEKAKGKQGPRHVFAGGAPEHDYDVILARPTDQSITISVLGYKSGKAFVSYGPEGDSVMKKTDIVELKPEFPAEILLSGLEPSRKYRYMISTSFGDANKFQSAEVESFYTQRKPGESFTFGVQADSHLDQGTNSATYELTLANVKKDDPDLFIDLGDTFMTDKYENYHDAEPQYFAQRYYFGLIGKTSPVFLTLGNHDGERMERNLGQGETMSSWSNRLRTRLFPNPVPDKFYSGNDIPMLPLGRLQNYYEWKWGDAQFIVLDPFWYTARRGRESETGNWSRTLGDDQYHWLEKVLNESKSKYKFVFIHHLVGGLDSSARGGSEAAVMYEWGGLGDMNMDEFRKYRPGWSMPIHQLLVKNKVSVVFHGHDHFFAKQDLDGVVYLLVPQPGHSGGNDRVRSTEEYGYKSGVFLPPAGYIRVKVEPSEATVDYIRTFLPQNENETRRNGQSSYQFKIQ